MSATPSTPTVTLDIAEGVGEICFNRPRQLNAIDVESARAFLEAVESVTRHPDVRVIVLRGAGRAFMAGGDLAQFRAAGEQAPEAARRIIDAAHAATLLLAEAAQPVIASVHGAVAGAGMSVALAADLAIAADDTVFNLAYVKVANSPDCSGSWTLPRIVGLRKAMEIALLSENIDANEALRLSLVNRVVPADQLAAETRKLALRLASAAPLSLASTKRLLRASLQNSLAAQLEMEAVSFATNAGTADFRESLAAFFDKRTPNYQGQ